MAIMREAQGAPDDSIVTEPRTATVRRWSPAQIVAVVIGIGSVILGISALARTGLALHHMTSPQHEVLGFRHAPLLGAIEIAFGALLIIAGVAVGAARSLMAFLGVVATTFGVLILIDDAPNRLHRWLGVGDPYGWLSLVVGVVLLLAAFFSPELVRTEGSREVPRRPLVD